ncbi:hypothetical protein AWB69_08888 [Caballeronia udeis]|uniref:Uncharacterized protein n=1 Tax=Caballeronia udeis TaxID=1232866 RepID=A0A158JXH7_9BURK|nr:hypothetical protein AWB69_08888 [Caballeronia udeis]
MRTAHGNGQHSLLRNGYASLCNSVRASFFDPCEPQLELDRSLCTQSKKSHANDLRKRRVHSSSCALVTAQQWCSVAQTTCIR